MTIPNWPSDLPQRFQTTGFSYQFAENRIMTQTDAGTIRVRRRFSRSFSPMTAMFYGSENDMLRLERFFKQDLQEGSLPFIIPDQTSDNLLLLYDDSGLYLTGDNDQPLRMSNYRLVQFGKNLPKKEVVSGDIYKVSFDFMVLD